MSGEVEAEASRPRPLSGGLWTLFSWLRREERCSSSDSLSSAGSDRTAASFAFLAPTQYRTKDPLILPPSGPPTDSYKKRLHERNLRRQHDRDITLHRKYGLFRSEGSGYDAFSLPPARRINGDSLCRSERDRRATSECLQRRVVHVPGKRRAPLPPIRASSAGPSTTLSRRYNRKRPAPQPPVNLSIITEEHIGGLQSNISIQMNSQPVRNKQQLENNDVSMGCKSEKYCKKDANNKTDIKTRSEKSFIKQIFENRKRNSAIETTSVKLLPNISELDKQAAEIIENCKLKEIERNNNDIQIKSVKTDSQGTTRPKTLDGETWICTKCLKKYNASVVICLHCLQIEKIHSNVSNKDNISKNANCCNNSTQTNSTTNVASTSRNRVEDKQKLKEMLKEMKDSLPKRPKQDLSDTTPAKNANIDKSEEKAKVLEMPTLRIGYPVPKEVKMSPFGQSSDLLKNEISSSGSKIKSNNDVFRKHHVLLQNTFLPDNVKLDKNKLQRESSQNVELPKIHFNAGPSKTSLHTPLKISSLLNPVYIPKNTISESIVPKSTESLQSKDTKLQKNNDNPITLIKPPDKLLTSSPFKTLITSTSQSSSFIANTPKEADLAVNIRKPSEVLKKNDKEQSTVVKSLGDSFMGPESSTEIQKIISENKLAVAKDTNIETVSKSDVNSNEVFSTNPSIATSSNKNFRSNPIIERLDQHSRRRDLINQLEQSIAKGDERAAADAAVKLAQLRLSCSVLSFSSQIVSQPSTSTSNSVEDKNIPCKISNKNEGKVNKKASPSHLVTTKAVQSESSVAEKCNNAKIVSVFPEHTPVKVSEPEPRNKLSTTDNKDEDKKTSLCEASTSKNAENKNNMVSIAVLVEDREAARGPVNLLIHRNAIMSQLRRQAEISLGLASRMQRWIVGRTLCTDDNTPLISLAGPDFSAPFYLCLVESSLKTSEDFVQRNHDDKAGNVYTELVKLEKQALVPNAEVFECGVCMEECAPGGGVVLRECVHSFCRRCLTDVVHHCEEPAVSCPAMACRGTLQEREIRALVSPEEYERWLARGLTAAESGTRNAFHCRTRDCTGWALCEPGVQRFPCPVCKRTNCVPCQAIHEGENCERYRARVKETVTKDDINQADEGTRALLNTLITRGEALECPECNAIITKKWGCDWVKCSACKTEICWVTRGRRWGPGGRGDTSGGCRCGVDGKRCHPSCGYCH